MKRIAVIIWGFRNSGKTTTIRHLVGVSKRLCNCNFKILNIQNTEIEVFVEGQSPSEKDQTLEELIHVYYKKDGLPNNIIVAEQINGKNAGSTINFLIKNQYKINFFVIQKPESYNKTHWDYNSKAIPSKIDLDKRIDDIRAVFSN